MTEVHDQIAQMDQWLSGRRVLVTGATGPLGRRMVERLTGKVARLRVLLRNPSTGFSPQTEIFQGDLSSAQSLVGVAEGCDTLIHLASYSPLLTDPDPENHSGHIEITTKGTKHLLEALRTSEIQRIVFAGSVRSLASAAEMSVYGQAKRDAEQSIFDYASQRGIHASVVRFPAFYGDPELGAISAMTRAISSGRFPPIPEFGNRRSFIHMDDAVSALLDVVSTDAASGKGFVATDGESYSTRDLYAGILHSLGRTPPNWTIPRPVFGLLARVGDVGEFWLRRPLPFNSQVLRKLSESYWFDDQEIRQVTGYRSKQTIWTMLQIDGIEQGFDVSVIH